MNTHLLFELKIPRNKYIVDESIHLEATLRNAGEETIELDSLNPYNRSLSFEIVDSRGNAKSGDLLSPITREGFPPIFPESFSTIILKPGEKKEVSTDLLAIFGELEEGKYTLTASYSSMPRVNVHSTPVKLTILKATPKYSKTDQNHISVVNMPIRTAWLNQESKGYNLFLMENSQRLPSNLNLNIKILKLDKPFQIIPAATETYGQEWEHMIWQTGNSLRVATVKGLLIPPPIKTVDPPLRSFHLLEPSFTDAEGNLYMLTSSGKRIYLIRIMLNKNAETIKLTESKGKLKLYSIIFDFNRKLHLASVYDEARECYYGSFDIHPSERPPAPAEIEKIAETDEAIVDVLLNQGYESDIREFVTYLYYLTTDERGTYRAYLTNTRNRRLERYSYCSIPGGEDLELLQSALDEENRWYQLFQDKNGRLWFTGYETPGLREAVPGEPSNSIKFPTLLITSHLSPYHGVYLRYIKNKSRFAYRLLKPLR